MDNYDAFVVTVNDYPAYFMLLKMVLALSLLGYVVAILIKLHDWRSGVSRWSETIFLALGPLLLLAVVFLGIDSGWQLNSQFYMPWNLGIRSGSTVHGTAGMPVWQIQLALLLIGSLLSFSSIYTATKARSVNEQRVKQGLPKRSISSFIFTRKR